MSEFRRRLMMVGSGGFEIPYITNGLAFYLDGYEKGNNAGKWTDLVGGVVWTPYGATDTNDGWYFSNGAYMTPDNTMSSFTYTGSTLEVCINSEVSQANYVIIVCPSASLVGVYVYSYTSYSWWTQKGPSSTSNKTGIRVGTPSENKGFGKITMTCATGVGGYYNLSYKSNNNVSYSAYDTPIIGKRIPTTSTGDPFLFTGTIYSIRIYNRKLSAAEMLANQQIDNQRFNLGLTI